MQKMEDLKSAVQALKKEKNAVILAHYYADGEVQSIADYVGDSFYLAKVAKSTDADILVFCGVEFMGESAKILNPQKTVLMPDASADCPMAHMATVQQVREMREKYDDLAVVCYINSSAELKTVSDVCVTSANALKIVQALPNKNIFFIPDKNLGGYVAEHSDKNVILNEGWCPIHNDITSSAVKTMKDQHPNAAVLMHPECPKDVLELADYIGSTSGIINRVAEDPAGEYIIVTENGVLWELKNRYPDASFVFPEPVPVCADMKKITLQKVYDCLKDNLNAVEIDEEKREKALIPLEKMLELAK